MRVNAKKKADMQEEKKTTFEVFEPTTLLEPQGTKFRKLTTIRKADESKAPSIEEFLSLRARNQKLEEAARI